MSTTKTTKHQFLDQIFGAKNEGSHKLKDQGKPLIDKMKTLAAKGEDILFDKLNIEDTAQTRTAYRKGMGTGGALALMLFSRSGRKLVTIGGLAGLGTLAYKAYKKNGGKIPKNKLDLVGALKGSKAESRADAILQAMISAAKADGRVDPDELEMIEKNTSANTDAVHKALKKKVNAKHIAALADSPQAAREIYAASARIANGLNPKERKYLDSLAMNLNLDPALAARLETDVRTG